jgi:hypothetical protein
MVLSLYFTRKPPVRKAAAAGFSQNSPFRQKKLFPAGFCGIMDSVSV